MSKARMIRYDFDPDNPPPLTQRQKDLLKKLEEKPDSEIDYSDLPDQSKRIVEEFGYRPHTRITTVRFDSDVLGWLHSLGKDYQKKMNDILRKEMLAAKAESTRVQHKVTPEAPKEKPRGRRRQTVS